MRAITRKESESFFIEGHYLKKWPRISYLFGLFKKDCGLVGAISYGTPSSPAARKSVAGETNANFVIELNRLFLTNNLKNEASFLISHSIKLLPRPLIIISYADNDQGHLGTIYRASNFRNGGQSESYHYDWRVRGKENLHQSTLFREFKNKVDKLEKMKEKYGDSLYKHKRSPKTRFFYIHALKRDAKRIENEINPLWNNGK